MDTAENHWTAQTWYQIAMALEAAAANKSLPSRLRRWLGVRAEAAWATGDWMNGISPEMWEEECRGYQAEDDAMVARLNSAGHSVSAPVQMELEMA